MGIMMNGVRTTHERVDIRVDVDDFLKVVASNMSEVYGFPVDECSIDKDGNLVHTYEEWYGRHSSDIREVLRKATDTDASAITVYGDLYRQMRKKNA